MIGSSKIWVLVVLIVALVGLTYVLNAKQTEPETKDYVDLSLGNEKQDEDLDQNEVVLKFEVVAENLNIPWSMVFTSPERMILTERTGNIRQIREGQLDGRILYRFERVSLSDEEGLMSLALHPDYTINKWVYAAVAERSGQEIEVNIYRLVDQEEQMVMDRLIWGGVPAARFHAGARIRFGPDRKLYISTGDALLKDRAQEVNFLGGKILRINDDGSIPTDNPWLDSPVWSLGHRNPQGFDWHPVTKEMLATEHGPSGFDGPGGGDEINLIVKGGNYGWPLVSHENSRAGMNDPVKVFTPAIAPASGMFYRGGLFREWQNSFFFGGLVGEGLFRATWNPETKEITEVAKMVSDRGRIREVVQSPDGEIWFSTSNRDGRGRINPGDDKIIKLTR